MILYIYIFTVYTVKKTIYKNKPKGFRAAHKVSYVSTKGPIGNPLDSELSTVALFLSVKLKRRA